MPNTYQLHPDHLVRKSTAQAIAIIDTVVNPFTVIVDTREQLPYRFEGLVRHGKRCIVPIDVLGLKCGDYSIRGFSHRVAVERKSLADLYHTLGQGRERFEREFEKLDELEFAAVVVEASLSEIANPTATRKNWVSLLNPLSVLGTIRSWMVRYPTVHWVMADNLAMAEQSVFAILEKFYDEKGMKHGKSRQ